MDRALVVNASPLILLARIDRLDLLASLTKLLVVPEAVLREIKAGPIVTGRPTRSRLSPPFFKLTIDRFPIASASGTWEPENPRS